MSRSQVGIIRHASVASAIVAALGVDAEPECRIGQWRITLTFRGLGASRWSEDRQIEYALRAAAVTRSVLSDDRRGAMRARANRAIEVVYEDAAALRGCAVTSRWECVVTAAANAAANLDDVELQ